MIKTTVKSLCRAAPVALLSISACASAQNKPSANAAAVRAFQGAWLYAQTCGFLHSINFEFHVAPNGEIQGTWAEGTRVRGEHGDLRGTYRDGRLYLRQCRADVDNNHAEACPLFFGNSYVTLQGNQLTWHKEYGRGQHEKYRTLHRVVKGKTTPTDGRGCDEEKNK